MNIEKQNKHYIGSNNYKYNKSYFICTQKVLDEIVIKNIDNAFYHSNHIIIDLNNSFGIVKDENGNILGSTKYVKLHVSKTGYHVVPRKEIKK